MLDHKQVLRALVKSVNRAGTVSVRETNFGYVIRSEKATSSEVLRAKVAKFAWVALWVAAIGLWIVPFGDMSWALRTVISLSMIAAGFGVFVLNRCVEAGFELHVDTNRRELRSAVLTPRGESWIRSSARFGEVSDVFMRGPKPETNLRSLCMKIIGESEVMPVAVGSEVTLLALHRRLMRDLRPIEERLAGYQIEEPTARGARSARREVFPQIGPDEIPV